MKNYLSLLLFLASIVLVACDNKVQKSYWENGNLKSELRYENGKLNGECVWYTHDGKVMTRASYKDDVLEGHVQRWHQNGKLERDCWYRHGQLDSLYLSYSESGRLASEEHYVDGKLHGEFKKWYDNGQVFQEGQYVDGMMDGLWYIFYPSGALAAKAEYTLGTGKQICYGESGYKCLEVHYLANQKHGRETYYNPDGSVTRIVEYEHGAVVFEDNDP